MWLCPRCWAECQTETGALDHCRVGLNSPALLQDTRLVGLWHAPGIVDAYHADGIGYRIFLRHEGLQRNRWQVDQTRRLLTRVYQLPYRDPLARWLPGVLRRLNGTQRVFQADYVVSADGQVLSCFWLRGSTRSVLHIFQRVSPEWLERKRRRARGSIGLRGIPVVNQFPL